MDGSGLASITGSSEAAPKSGNPNRTNRLLGITRHQITSFSIVNDTDNVGQLSRLAKLQPQFIFINTLLTGDRKARAGCHRAGF